MKRKKRLLVICVEGASASSKKESNTLSSVAKRVLKGSDIVYTLLECNPAWWFLKKRRIRKILDIVQANQVLFIGKSLGAVKLIKSIPKFKELTYFTKVDLFTVDPHQLFSNRTLCCPKTVNNGYNIYQIDKWPRGQAVFGSYNTVVDNCDHHSIIHQKETYDLLKEVIG